MAKPLREVQVGVHLGRPMVADDEDEALLQLAARGQPVAEAPDDPVDPFEGPQYRWGLGSALMRVAVHGGELREAKLPRLVYRA